MLYKRPNSQFWWCKFQAPDGRRIQQSTKTVDKELALEFEAKLRYQQWRVTQLGERPRRTWKEAVVRWRKETTRKSIEGDLDQIKWLDKYVGHLYLDQINRDLIDRIRMTN